MPGDLASKAAKIATLEIFPLYGIPYSPKQITFIVNFSQTIVLRSTGIV